MKIKLIAFLSGILYLKSFNVSEGKVNVFIPSYYILQQMQNISFASGKIKFLIPGNLKRLNDSELSDESYRSHQKPTAVFEDKTNMIKFAVNFGSSDAQDKDIEQIKNLLEQSYKKVAVNFISSNMSAINKKKIVTMKFEVQDSYTNARIFNYLFMTIINHKVFLADYSFPSNLRSTQEFQAESIFKSLEIKN